MSNDATVVLVNDEGKQIGECPLRETFPAGVDGTVAWLEACYRSRDQVAAEARKAFDVGFRRAMRKK